jgi:SET domain-containing protein
MTRFGAVLTKTCQEWCSPLCHYTITDTRRWTKRCALRHLYDMPLCDGLQVIRSPIHGYGVIATRMFRKGEILCEGEGVLYNEDAEFDDTYSLVFDGDAMNPPIDEQVFYDLVCQTRWINHSCEPNTTVDSRQTSASGGVVDGQPRHCCWRRTHLRLCIYCTVC